TNALVWAQGDDGFDADQSWSGTLSNGIVIMSDESGSALELDGPEGSAATEDGFTMERITLIGNGSNSYYADLRDGRIASLNNVLAQGLGAPASVNSAGDTATELANEPRTFANRETVLPAGVLAGDFF